MGGGLIGIEYWIVFIYVVDFVFGLARCFLILVILLLLLLVLSFVNFLFFFFKQKTAYEMRISYWSSDVCSSDLCPGRALVGRQGLAARRLSHGRRWSLQLQIDPPQKLSNPDRRHCWRNARGHEPQPDAARPHPFQSRERWVRPAHHPCVRGRGRVSRFRRGIRRARLVHRQLCAA